MYANDPSTEKMEAGGSMVKTSLEGQHKQHEILSSKKKKKVLEK